MTDHVHVRTDEPIGHVAPEVHGFFAEHLGRCVYDGIWVGRDADVDHADGVRTDTLSLLRDLDPSLVRWPGGCFADAYDWEDGVGPVEDRPRRLNVWWGSEESNAFGTEEFLSLCRDLDAAPFLCLNVGSGTPREAMRWVEYCNYDGDSEYARKRAANGHEEPHGVVYWSVGNENWGCGGDFDPADYAREYRRYVTYLRALERHLPEPIELVAVGHATSVTWDDPFAIARHDWNPTLLDHLAAPDHTFSGMRDYPVLDHLSIHRYLQCGDGVEFTDDEHYGLLAGVDDLRGDIERAESALRTYAPGREIGIAVDEWGAWHPRATENDLEQENTVRDALLAAATLDLFHDRADVVSVATLAQVVNVLQSVVETDADGAWPTPTYRVFDLYRPHKGADALRTRVETDAVDSDAADRPVAVLSASASARDGDLFVTLSNRHLDDARTVRLHVDRTVKADDVSARVLFRDRGPREYSTPDSAGDFAPADHAVDVAPTGEIDVGAPPCSAIAVEIAG